MNLSDTQIQEAQNILNRLLVSRGQISCVECGRIYTPARKPAYNRRNYCLECRESGIPDRDSKRDQRAKVKIS